MQITHFIEVDAIVIPDYRIRKEFDVGELADLAESIKAKGLMHAIVLRSDKETLIAGERRLRAIKDIYFMGGEFSYNGIRCKAPLIPYTILSELSPIEQEEAELEENLRRSQLTWQEEAAAMTRLRTLRHEKAQAEGKPWEPLTEFVEEVGQTMKPVVEKLEVGRHLSDPDVAAAKSVKEAKKIVRRKEAAKRSAELANSVGATFGKASHQLFNCDSLEWMKSCDAEQFDVILTDPPYGMGADEFGDSGGLAAGEHGYRDDEETFMTITGVLAHQSFRIAKPEAHIYWFCDIDWINVIRFTLKDAGWKVFRTPLIWHKPNAMRAPWPENGPQRKYETLIFAVKGNKKVLKLMGDVLTYNPDENLGIAAQKPVTLFEDLLKRSCLPGDKVLDPFMGSGPIVPAAHSLKCYATGIELDPAHYGIAVKRMEDLP